MSNNCVSCETNKQDVTITKKTIEGLKETICNLYLADDTVGNWIFRGEG